MLKKSFFIFLLFSMSIAVAELSARFLAQALTVYELEMWRYSVLLKQNVPDGRRFIHIPGRSAKLMNVEVQTNSFGLRDQEFSLHKKPGTIRMLTIGDSLTLGWGVPIADTFSKRLERAWSKPRQPVEVMNLGIGNYNTEQELESFLLQGKNYEPDAALLMIYINDVEPVQPEEKVYFYQRHSYIAAYLKTIYRRMKYLLGEGPRYADYYKQMYTGQSWQRFRSHLARFAHEAESAKIALIPVLLPDLRNLHDYPFEEIHALLQKEFSTLGLRTIDLLPAFRGRDERALWVAIDDPHPNSEAHRIIAEAILENFRERKVPFAEKISAD